MKQFLYRVRDKEGKIQTGTVESVSAQTAARALQERQFLVISLLEKQRFDLKNLAAGFLSGKVGGREVANFTRLLATMLSVGLPLTEALSNLAAQNQGQFKEIIQAISHDVQTGVALSEAMSRWPAAFDGLYVNLVRAGEASGKADETLNKLADMLEANLDFKAKVKGAMIYPAVVVTAMGGIGVFMLTSIIPKIAEVYKEFGAELPLPTRILIAISDFLRNYTAFLLVILAVFLYFTGRTLRKNPTSEYLINNLMFKMPVMGPLSAEITLAIVCRTLSTLLASGVAILDALKLVAKVIANNYFRAGLTAAATAVEKGLPLSLALRRNPDFPLMVSQLLAIGEETGTVDQSLGRLAGFYQDSAERKIKVLTTLLEPIMILLMGGMVAGLALAVLLPMFNLVNVIK